MGFNVNPVNINPFLASSTATSRKQTSTAKAEVSDAKSAAVPAKAENSTINEVGEKVINALDSLAAIAGVDLLMGGKRKRRKVKARKREPQKEGIFPNPFADTEEQELYYEHNFAHGKVVDPFEYRKEWHWKKFILLEKLSDFLNEECEIYDPTKPSTEMPAIRATHLKQGSISNCWLIATMALLVQKQPETIINMIKVDKENNKYEVSLIGGKLQIRLTPENIKPAVVAKTGAAWAGIIEAAVAKAVGISYFEQSESIDINTISEKQLVDRGYDIISDGNFCSYAIYYLTGNKTKYWFLELDKDYSSFYFNWKDKQIVLGCHHYEARRINCPEFDRNGDGIVSDHAYTLLEHVPESNLYLFNPWGEYEPGTLTYSKAGRFNSQDLCNDGMFCITGREFLEKRTWTVYEITDEPAYSLNLVLHCPLPPYFNPQQYSLVSNNILIPG